MHGQTLVKFKWHSYPDQRLPHVSVPLGNTQDSTLAMTTFIQNQPINMKHVPVMVHQLILIPGPRKKFQFPFPLRSVTPFMWCSECITYYSSDSQHMAPCTSLFAPPTTNSKQPYTQYHYTKRQICLSFHEVYFLIYMHFSIILFIIDILIFKALRSTE